MRHETHDSSEHFEFDLLFAEASCSSAVRLARNVVADVGSAAASSGIDELARLSTSNSERDDHRFLSQKKLTLPIRITNLGQSKNLRHPVFLLRNWMDYVVNKNLLHVLAGLRKRNPRRQAAIFSEFWQLYKLENADHPVYDLEARGLLDLSKCVPLAWHGDEGRGRRRKPFLVCSYHSLIGQGVKPGLEAEQHSGIKKHLVRLLANFQGHSYTTRYLHAAMSKETFEDDTVMEALLEQVVTESDFMMSTGITHRYNQERFHAVVLCVCGDWQWLWKAGRMTRSYLNTAKHYRLVGAPQGICHLCRAGQTEHPFEQLATRTPSWLQTFCLDEPFATGSPLTRLPHPSGRMPTLFRYDLFHAFHLGAGKSFTASVLAIMSTHFEGRSKEARFEALNAADVTWRRGSGHPPTLSRITKECINWDSNSSYPVGQWYKGNITRILCAFIEDYLKQGHAQDELLDLSLQAAEAINACLSGIYKGDAFLEAAEAKRLGEFGLRFLRRYSQLASRCHERGQALFSMLPKLHALQHLFLQDMVMAAGRVSHVMSPLCYSTQISEDYIGRNSRTSRRVHPATVSQRVMQRHLEHAHSKYVEAGYLIKGKD